MPFRNMVKALRNLRLQRDLLFNNYCDLKDDRDSRLDQIKVLTSDSEGEYVRTLTLVALDDYLDAKSHVEILRVELVQYRAFKMAATKIKIMVRNLLTLLVSHLESLEALGPVVIIPPDNGQQVVLSDTEDD